MCVLHMFIHILQRHEESLGISQCEDIQPSRRLDMSQDNSLMMESMTTSQIAMSHSMTASMYQPKSSIKKQTSKKITSNVGFNGVKGDVEFPGYNKLRLDSAVSPKHQPKINKSAQSPRNYVLEKNWQNSIQNGNFCPQYEDNKYQNNEIKNSKSSNMTGSLTAINMNTSYSQKSSIVARNLHSNIVFDNKTSYSDGENVTTIENEMKLPIGDSKKTTSDTISDAKNYVTNGVDSPGGTLKRNKNTKNSIFRSKSGSNVPTCFDDSNYDSFDDSQIDIYDYSKASGDDSKSMHSNIKEDFNSGTSTPEVCDK